MTIVKNTTREHSERIVTLLTFDQSDEETWPDQQKDNDIDKDKYKDKDKDKYIKRTPSKSDSRDLWPLRHLIRVMRGHDLTNKKTMTKTKIITKTKTMTNTFRKHPQRVIVDTFDPWDIWCEWWGDITWSTKRQWQKQWQWNNDKDNDNLKTPSKNNPKDWWHLRHWLNF